MNTLTRAQFNALSFLAQAKSENTVATIADGIAVKQPPVCAPHVVNLTLPDIKSETMLNFLSGKDLALVKKTAMQGTILAHVDGGVPNKGVGGIYRPASDPVSSGGG